MPIPYTTACLTVFAALFGLLIGSFLNVCIYRLPKHETIVRGHSYCPKCHHSLSGADLVPVFSYLLLGRRCRYCREPISGRYARIELTTSVYFALAAFLWSPTRSSILQSRQPGYLGVLTPELYVLILIGLILACFSSLLVWAMILADQNQPPYGLYLFTIIPAAGRLLFQPELLLSHLAAMIFTGLFCFFLHWLHLLPQDAPDKLRHEITGLALLGLTAGLTAMQPVLVFYLIEGTLLAIWQNKKGESERTVRLARMLPPVGVLVGFAALLFF